MYDSTVVYYTVPIIMLQVLLIIGNDACFDFSVYPHTGNRVHGNGRTLKDALCSGKCLFSISGDNSYPMHDFYRCLTCDSSESDAICANCVKSCHRDHRVQFVRHDRSVCVCGWVGVLEHVYNHVCVCLHACANYPNVQWMMANTPA